MTRGLWMVLPIVLLTGLIQAQSSDRVEIFGGYTYINPDFSLVSGNGASGWNASVNFKARRWIGVVADFSGLYPRYTYPPLSGSTTASGNAYTLLFGPQISAPFGRFSPFGRFLVGTAHVSPQTFDGTTMTIFKSDNAFSWAAGGGVDYSVVPHVAVRGQLDWLYVSLSPIGGGDPGANYAKNRNVARISTGVVLRF